MKSPIRVALAGNPNSGKTTIFNAITGARQHVGNYPGVTVEKKEGIHRRNGREIHIVDLPGIYSLTAHSTEEIIARNYLIENKPDVVVDILDITNLERNLYLAVQLMELEVPLILAFNMSDMARSRGIDVDLEKFSELFGIQVIPTVGHKGRGIPELLEAIEQVADGKGKGAKTRIQYGSDIENEISKIEEMVVGENGDLAAYHKRWLAVKLLEQDSEISPKVKSKKLHEAIVHSTDRLLELYNDPLPIILADRRYGYISGICQEAVRSTAELRHTESDKIDAIVAHRVLGLPIFLGIMYSVFHLTFTLGDPMMGVIESFFGWLGDFTSSLWPAGSDSAIRSLLVDGIIGGVGGVIVFLPNIVLLFLAIALLEDTGYMARAAFIMDRLMHKMGLHGKSFIPMLIGFGCSVPAIMASRTLESRRDQFTTLLVTPLISCSARLPIYLLIIPTFFPRQWHAPVLWIIYLTGIGLAVLLARLLRTTILKGESTAFIMELPPFRIPTPKGLLIHMWERATLYLKKAGTLILAVSILMWIISSYPQKSSYDIDSQNHSATMSETEIEQAKQMEDLSYSVAGRIGTAVEPVLGFMGFDWRIGTALIGAFAAKEVFVAQMGIVYSIGDAHEASDALRDRLRRDYSPLIAFCIMLFTLISAPCMATIAITKRETNSWRWPLVQLGGLTLLAFVLTVTVFQVGSLLNLGT